MAVTVLDTSTGCTEEMMCVYFVSVCVCGSLLFSGYYQHLRTFRDHVRKSLNNWQNHDLRECY